MQKKIAFADLLNIYLKRRERSAAWLAGKLKTSVSTVSRWTNGETKPGSMATVTQVIELLEVDNDQERAKLYQAAGFSMPTTQEPPHVAQSHPPSLAANGQPHEDTPLLL